MAYVHVGIIRMIK